MFYLSTLDQFLLLVLTHTHMVHAQKYRLCNPLKYWDFIFKLPKTGLFQEIEVANFCINTAAWVQAPDIIHVYNCIPVDKDSWSCEIWTMSVMRDHMFRFFVCLHLIHIDNMVSMNCWHFIHGQQAEYRAISFFVVNLEYEILHWWILLKIHGKYHSSIHSPSHICKK